MYDDTETLQTRHVYSTLKRRGNGCFRVVSRRNTRGVFAGKSVFFRTWDVVDNPWKN